MHCVFESFTPKKKMNKMRLDTAAEQRKVLQTRVLANKSDVVIYGGES